MKREGDDWSFVILNDDGKKVSSGSFRNVGTGHHPHVFLTDDGKRFAMVWLDPEAADAIAITVYSQKGNVEGNAKLDEIFDKTEIKNLPKYKHHCNELGFVYLDRGDAVLEGEFLKMKSPTGRTVFFYLDKAVVFSWQVASRIVQDEKLKSGDELAGKITGILKDLSDEDPEVREKAIAGMKSLPRESVVALADWMQQASSTDSRRAPVEEAIREIFIRGKSEK